MNGKLRKILMAVLAAVFVTGIGLSVYQSYQYAQAQQLQDRAQQLVQVPEPKPVELLPEVDTPLAPAPEMDENAKELAKLELTALQQENPDVLGWITIPETKISYPLMAADTPDEYLHTAWDGSYNYAGSIYLECQNDRELSDFHSLIYGHNMANGTMFGNLILYKDQAFRDAHPYVYIVSGGKIRRYEIFAAYEAEVESDTYCIGFQSESRKQQAIDGFLSRSVITAEVVPAPEDSIITLSTCTGFGDYDHRWVVQARLDAQWTVAQ